MSRRDAPAQRNAKTEPDGVRRFAGAAAFCALLALDRAAKLWALAALPEQADARVAALSLLRNRGVSFSLLADLPRLPLLLSAVAVACLTSLYARARRPLARAGLLLMLAGAGGNLIDRLYWGYVVDWLRIAGLHVNLADAYICAGAALLLKEALARR